MQYSNSTGYSKTKTLATLGNGNINIANSDEQTFARLNRDTTQTNKDIFNTKRQQGNIDLTIDTRLFSEDGRNAIKDDVKHIAIMGSVIADLGDESVSFFGDRAGGQDSFRQQLIKRQAFYTGSKFLASNKGKDFVDGIVNGAAALQDKEAADTALVNAVAKELGLPATQVRLLFQKELNLNTREGRKIYAAYGKEIKTLFVVDNNNKTTGQTINSVGVEINRYIDNMRDGDAAYTKTQKYRDARTSNSKLMGAALEDYTSFVLALSGLDLTAKNTFNGTLDTNKRPTQAVLDNNKLFNSLNPNEIEYRQMNLAEGNLINRTAGAFAKQNKITPEKGLERLRQQAMRQIDSDVLYQDGITDKAASKWLGDLTVAFLKGRTEEYDVELFNATQAQKDDHSLFAEQQANVDAVLNQPLDTEQNQWVNTFINSKYSIDLTQAQSNRSRLNALARVELRDEAFANGDYGNNALIYGFTDASNNLRALNELKGYANANGIVLNPNDITRLGRGQFDFNQEATAGIEAFGLKPRLMRRNSYGYNGGTAEGQRDIFQEATRYATKGSATPLLIFNNGNITNEQLASRVDRELGGYLTKPQKNITQNALTNTTTGQSLDLSLALEYTTAKTAANNPNFMTGFTEYNRRVAKNSTLWENQSEKITQYSAGLVEQTVRNWEITFSDENAPAYMKENAAAGVALDIAVVAPLLKGMRLGKAGKGVTIVDSEVAALERIRLNGVKNQRLNQRINARVATNILLEKNALRRISNNQKGGVLLNQKINRRASTEFNFNTLGVSESKAREFLLSSEGDNLLIALKLSDRTATESVILNRAMRFVTSGSEVPAMKLFKPGTPLVKIVPEGSGVSTVSPFFTTSQELNKISRSGMTLSDAFGLPIGSEAVKFSVFEIKALRNAEVFLSKSAPTVENQIRRQGGAIQFLVPRRTLFSEPKLIGSINN